MRGPYSRVRVRGLVLVAHYPQTPLSIGAGRHLILEAHVVLDVLARHPDLVGDLVEVVTLLGTGEDAGAAQAVDGRMVGVFRVDVPFVFLDLARDPFLPPATDGAALFGVGKPASPARSQPVGGVVRTLRGIEAYAALRPCPHARMALPGAHGSPRRPVAICRSSEFVGL